MAGGPAAVGNGVGAHAPKHNWAGIMMIMFSAFGGLLFGYDTGTISGIKEMKPFLQTFGHEQHNTATGYALSASNESLVVSILSAGTFFGALLGAPVGDIVGRRIGIIVSCVVFCIGIALQTGASSFGVFVVGRVFAGLGVGLISCLVVMYQAECSPRWIRGTVTAGYQFCITIGIMLASIVNNATKNYNGKSAYQIPVALQFAWAGILMIGMFFLPESPRWLVKKGRDETAARSLCKITGIKDDSHHAIQSELLEIQENLRLERDLGESGYTDCFKSSPNKILTRTMTGIFIQAMQQLTGINFIFYYGTTFFLNSGFKDPFLIGVVTNIVNVLSTLPGMYLIEKVGRRPLLLYGAAGMAICEYIVAIVGVTISVHNVAGQKVLIAFVCIYIAFFAATWGPIAWVVTGEIFPLQVRAKATSLSVASNWLWNFAIAYATPYLVNSEPGCAGLGPKVFFLWGSTCACCVIFTYFMVPETKGFSLEEIDQMYRETTPRKSIDYHRRYKRDFETTRGAELADAKEVGFDRTSSKRDEDFDNKLDKPKY